MKRKTGMQKYQNLLYGAIIASEASHVFCCVLPTLFSVVSLLVGLGMMGAMPVWLHDFHAMLHAWEIPLIALSGFVVALGWALHVYSRRIDCHDTGCHHGPCEPKKKRADTILKVASVLFVFNVGVYTLFHWGVESGRYEAAVHAENSDHKH